MNRFIASVAIYAVLVVTGWLAAIIDGAWYTWLGPCSRRSGCCSCSATATARPSSRRRRCSAARVRRRPRRAHGRSSSRSLGDRTGSPGCCSSPARSVAAARRARATAIRSAAMPDRPALHDLRRRRARRHAPADAADVRVEGARPARAHSRRHAALLRARPRAAAADPAADDASSASTSRASSTCCDSRTSCAACRRGWSALEQELRDEIQQRAPLLPARARPLPAVTSPSAEEVTNGLQQR